MSVSDPAAGPSDSGPREGRGIRDREGRDEQYKAPRAAFTLSDFTILRNIGDGSYSTVVLAQRKGAELVDPGGDPGLYAIKIVNKHLVRRSHV